MKKIVGKLSYVCVVGEIGPVVASSYGFGHVERPSQVVVICSPSD